MSQNVYAEVITVGDEILYGQITNTNSQFISTALDSAGFRTLRQITVGDSETEILTALSEAEPRAEVILITGGLGPTRDDITKKTLAKYFNCEMAVNEKAHQELLAYMAYRGRTLNGLNQFQSVLPVAAEPISNKVGTAPGMWFNRKGKVFVSMPGVPAEMKEMLVNIIMPRLRETYKTPALYHKVVRTSGIPESVLAERITDWEDALPEHIKLAYLPSFGGVKLRLTAEGSNLDQLKIDTGVLAASLKPLVGEFIYADDDAELEQTIASSLKANGQTLSLAESCTGGSLSALLTSKPGSSLWYKGGLVAYSQAAKINLLLVKPQTIAEHGVYSLQTVEEMAENVRRLFNTDYGIATSGVAGPDPDGAVPAGTVFIAVNSAEGTVSKQLKLGIDRDINIRLTNTYLLTMLLAQINL